MKFKDFISSMSDAQLDAYALRCGTSANYLRGHLKGGTRVPRAKLLNALWQNSKGKVSKQDVFEHFLSPKIAA